MDNNRNTFAHAILQSQTEYDDGTFLDRNRVVRWYHIGSIQPVVIRRSHHSCCSCSGQFSRQCVRSKSTRDVTSATFDPKITVGGRIWVYWELEHPWWHLTRNETHGSQVVQEERSHHRCFLQPVQRACALVDLDAGRRFYEHGRASSSTLV
jgi:hypothetical protein